MKNITFANIDNYTVETPTIPELPMILDSTINITVGTNESQTITISNGKQLLIPPRMVKH